MPGVPAQSCGDGRTQERLRGAAGSAAADLPIEIRFGADGLLAAASMPEADTVVTAVVGMVGLDPPWPPFKRESASPWPIRRLWFAPGELVMRAAGSTARRSSRWTRSIPPFFSAWPDVGTGVRFAGLILTCSGGPFFGKTAGSPCLRNPGRRRAPPNWPMGAKITVDCATLMNKGLELMEAMQLSADRSDSRHS